MNYAKLREAHRKINCRLCNGITSVEQERNSALSWSSSRGWFIDGNAIRTLCEDCKEKVRTYVKR